jgi:hypothetical protein
VTGTPTAIASLTLSKKVMIRLFFCVNSYNYSSSYFIIVYFFWDFNSFRKIKP